MTTETTTPRPPKRLFRRILRALSIAFGVIVVLIAAAHFRWKYSGSTEWKQELDKNGIKVYSLKTPGRTLKDWKAVRRLKTTLNVAVAGMTTTATEDCAQFDPNCVSIKAVQPWNPHTLTGVQLYRATPPSPFSPRELLISTQTTQDPKNKSVLIAFEARPDDLPRNECCLRITEYHNSWRFTPVGNGETEVELQIHMDQQVPYFLINRISPRALYKMLNRLPKYLDQPKWQQAKFESIQEQ